MDPTLEGQQAPTADGPTQGIFPGLTDGTPGDSRDSVQQVQPGALPGLYDTPSVPIQTSTAPAQHPTDAEPAGPAPVVIDGGERPAAPSARRRTAEERIATLTRRYHEADSGRKTAESQLAEITQLLMQQQTEIERLSQSRPAPAPAAAPSAADPFGLGTSPAAPSPSNPSPAATPSLGDIERVVTRAIETYDQRVRGESAAQAQLVDSHRASLQDALAEFPELGAEGSAARAHFNRLYATSPLRSLPDAPYQIALQVRGILADEARPAPGNGDRKRQATVIPPAPSTSDLPNVGAAAAVAEFNRLGKEMKAGNTDYNVYRRWRQLRDKIQGAAAGVR